MWLRSISVLCCTSALMLACGQKEEPIVEAPAAVGALPVSGVKSAEPATGGGYEPTPEERVPGITEPAN